MSQVDARGLGRAGDLVLLALRLVVCVALSVAHRPSVGAIRLVEVAGGVAIALGALVRAAALLNAFVSCGALLAAMTRGPSAPSSVAGFVSGHLGQVLLVAGLLAVAVAGPGNWSVRSVLRRRASRRMRPLTVIAKVKEGRVPALRTLLESINDNIQGNPYISFADDLMTHFARWFIFETSEAGGRLAFVSTYQGDLESYVRMLMAVSPGLDDIWNNCEDYTGRPEFYKFVCAHCIEPSYCYAAYPYETVAGIRTKIRISRDLEDFLDHPDVTPFLTDVSSVVRPSALAALDRLTTALVSRVIAWGHNIIGSVAQWATPIYANAGAPKQFTRVLDTCSDPERRRVYLQHLTDLEKSEGRFAQNNLTVLAPIADGRLLRLRLALRLGGIVARYGYPPGELTGTYTIHFLHWAIFDGGKYALVMSDYDGSWQNYLGDFSDKLKDGLNALFNNCMDYPPGGLNRTEAWGQWIRSNQIVCSLFYRAYPRETAIHIAQDRIRARTVARCLMPILSGKQDERPPR
jgi:hypothetical protein